MAIDYTIPQFQTAQDASIPKGIIQTPTTPSPVYSTPDIGSIYDQTVQPESQLSKETTAGLNFYKQLLGEQAQSQQEQAQQFQNLGGTEAQTRLADLTAQYNVADLQNQAQQQAYLGQTRNIGGYTQTAQNLGMEDINRANAVKKLGLASDIAINQGRVDTAKSLAEQAIKAKYGDVQAKIDQTKAFLDVNKDLLSREDAKNLQRQQFILQNKQKEIDAKVKDQTDISNMIIDATPNAPESIITNAKKLAESGASKLAVAQALGIYGGDYLGNEVKKAQLYKLGLENKKAIQELYDKAGTGGLKTLSYEENAKFNSTPEVKNINAANAYARAISEYKDAINKYGTGEWFGKGSGALGQAYSALVGATKDYYTLGTLDNGVQKLIALGIPEPGVVGLKSNRIGALDEALSQASQTLKANIDQLSSTSYKNTNEFKNLIDTSSGVLMNRMSNEELLSSIPGASTSMNNNTSTNQSFFNK